MTEQYLQASINLMSAPALFSGGIGPVDVLIPGAVVTGMPIQVVEESTPLISHTLGSSELEFEADGIALISWFVSISVAAGQRKSSQTSLFFDDGSGFLPVNLSFGFGYHRNVNNGFDTTGGRKRLAVKKGDKIEIVSQRVAGTNNLEFVGSSCSVMVGLIPEQ